jgi:hypothetical protein
MVEHQWACRAASETGRRPGREQRPVGHTHARQFESRPEVERQSRASGMVAPGGVCHNHIRRVGQRAHRRFQEGTLTQRKEAGLIGSGRVSAYDRTAHLPPIARHQNRSGPGRLTRQRRSSLSAPEADEAAGHERSPTGRLPDRRR